VKEVFVFTPVSSLVGGVLIGLSAAALLIGHGRIAGISGILDGALRNRGGELTWRLLFLAGLVGGGLLLTWIRPQAFPTHHESSGPLLMAAGLLVGFGTRLGNGCTSGHGVCGIGRLSPRSILATLTFIAAGAATVFIVRHVIGGRP
jgi:uncharacterized membrane protein YedE/YeeE